MRVIKPINQSLVYKTFKYRKEHLLTAAVMTGFSLADPKKIFSEMDLWASVSKAYGKDNMFDECMPKLNGEVLLSGKFHAPEGKPVSAGEVSFRVGALKKQLYVFGDRFWREMGLISDPAPITELDIYFANCFGGPDFKRNPTGKGASPIETKDGKKVRPLPNIEHPDRLIGSPDDRPEPASFGTLDLMWPQRFSLVGTYGEKWLKEDAPGLASDIDWSYFNMAPKDQQIAGYFKGDEKVEITNMHPERSRIVSTLPSIRSRVFITRKTDDGPQFKELSLNLDTVWLFPNDDLGIIIWRSTVETVDEDVSDVEQILIAYEDVEDAPRSEDHYREALKKRLDKDEGYLLLLDERDLIPLKAENFFANIIQEAKQQDNKLAENIKARTEQKVEELRDTIKKRGLDPDDYIKIPGPKEIDIDEMHKIAKQVAQAQKNPGEALKLLAPEQADMIEKGMAKLKKPGDTVPLPRLPKDTIKQLSEMMDKAGMTNEDVKKQLESNSFEKMFRLGYYKSGHKYPQFILPSPEACEKTRQYVIDTYKRGESLSDGDFAASDLSSLNLVKADFSNSFLEHVNFKNANLQNADFSGSFLLRTNFAGANLCSANFKDCTMGGADLTEADLSGATLENTILAEANLTATDFTGAMITAGDFSNARLQKTNFNQTVFINTLFIDATLEEVLFTRASIKAITFFRCVLKNCDFSEAEGEGACFIMVTAEKPVFRQACMKSLRFTLGSTAPYADFEGARMEQSNFRECDLRGANFSHTLLDMSDFSEADLTGANFYRAVAKRAMFMKTDLTGASMVSVNIMEGNLRKARLVRSDFRGANLFAAEFIDVTVGETDFRFADLNKTKLRDWAPSK